MTNRDPGPSTTHSAKRFAHTAGAMGGTVMLAGLLMVGLTQAGCGEEPAPPPPPPAPAPPPPPDPAEALRDLAPGVQFPEENLPSSLDAAEAIVAFANAFRGGDRNEVGSYLTPATNADLMTMIPARVWQQTMENVEAVRVCIVEDLGSSATRVGLGIQEPDGAYLLGWQATRAGDEWKWEAVAVGNPTAPRVAMLDARRLPDPEATDQGAGVSTPEQADDDEGQDQDQPGTNRQPASRREM